MRKLGLVVAAGMAFLGPIGASGAMAQHEERFGAAAYQGKIADGISEFEKTVAGAPDDASARLALGALTFLSAIEGLQQDLYRLGAGNRPAGMRRGFLPVFRVPVPPNPSPEVASYEEVRGLLGRFSDRLRTAKAILSEIGDRPAKLRIDLLKIGFDINGDGNVSNFEKLAATLDGMRFRGRGDLTALVEPIAFDTADAKWLMGYSSVLMSVADFFLSFDFEKSYDTVFHVVFGEKATRFGRQLAGLSGSAEEIEAVEAEIRKAEQEMEKAFSREERKRLSEIYRDQRKIRLDKSLTPEERKAKLEESKPEFDRLVKAQREQSSHRGRVRTLRQRRAMLDPANNANPSFGAWLDPIGFLHSISWKVVDPDRLKRVRADLLDVVRLSRETWRLAALETDDDREWLPNPKQTSPFKSLTVTQEIIDSWLQTLTGLEAVLEGKMLVPSMRFGRGINMKKFFETADSFDLVLFLTGPNSAAYAEKGPVIDSRFMRSMGGPMGRSFGAYAIWFN